MKRLANFLVVVFLLTACNGGGRDQLQVLMNDPQSGLLQEKKVGGVTIKLTYLPACWEQLNNRSAKADPSEMCFRINVFRPHSDGTTAKEQEINASYGLDTLFQLILNRDTLSPILAQRIANGNFRGAEYLVIFERRPLEAVQQAALVYKDWLFSATRLVFPLQKNYLQKSDSLSCHL